MQRQRDIGRSQRFSNCVNVKITSFNLTLLQLKRLNTKWFNNNIKYKINKVCVSSNDLDAIAASASSLFGFFLACLIFSLFSNSAYIFRCNLQMWVLEFVGFILKSLRHILSHQNFFICNYFCLCQTNS